MLSTQWASLFSVTVKQSCAKVLTTRNDERRLASTMVSSALCCERRVCMPSSLLPRTFLHLPTLYFSQPRCTYGRLAGHRPQLPEPTDGGTPQALRDSSPLSTRWVAACIRVCIVVSAGMPPEWVRPRSGDPRDDDLEQLPVEYVARHDTGTSTVPWTVRQWWL